MSGEAHTAITVVTEGLAKQLRSGAGTPCVVVFYGRDIGKRYFLDKDLLMVGRSDSANIQVDQESVSRNHAKIVNENEHFRLYDLGSTNGTFVNDQRVDATELRDGDFIRIGQTIFKYLSGSNLESKYHEEIYRLTTIDGLTKAYNKRYMFETLERELNRAKRYHRVLSFVMFDIDHFKKANDTHGHLAGDYVLRKLSELVHENLRREDVFCRYGGEEFALLLPEITREDSLNVSEKLRSLTEKTEFIYAGERVAVTISLGIVHFDGHTPDVSVTDLVDLADKKLYEAKSSGRNRVCI